MKRGLAIVPFLLLACATAEPHVPAASAVRRASAAGRWEGELQTAPAPIFVTLTFDSAGGGWTGSLDILGQTVPLQQVVAQGVGVEASVGDPVEGERLDARVEGDVLAGSMLLGGERMPFRLDRLPALSAPAGRDDAWRQDLDALATRFPRADRSLSPAERVEFLARVADMRAHVAELTDQQIMMGMAEAIALTDNPHSRLYIVRTRTRVRFVPLRVWWFAGELRVVSARPEQADLLGCRVDAIEGMPVRDVRARLAPAYGGQPSWVDYMTTYLIASPDALHGAGIARSPDATRWRVSDCSRSTGDVELRADSLAPGNRAVEAWWELSPFSAAAGWHQALPAQREALPLYLRNPERNYWFDYLPAERILYFQFNRASQAADEPIEAFAQRLLGAIDSLDVRAVVVDIRFNTGGNLSLAEPLMDALYERTAAIPRFIITGRATFSAGITPAAAWNERGGVTIVGEPVADRLDFMAEGGNIILPNSGLAAHFANALHSYSTAPCDPAVPCYLDLASPGLEPDLPATATWADYVARRDPALEAIVAEMRR